ncbi:hypothetical protein BLOT_012686 [Blomia tropicalis]|nr:hypothetical protein BLOT_012686 [Blomia tropicalis]
MLMPFFLLSNQLKTNLQLFDFFETHGQVQITQSWSSLYHPSCLTFRYDWQSMFLDPDSNHKTELRTEDEVKGFGKSTNGNVCLYHWNDEDVIVADGQDPEGDQTRILLALGSTDHYLNNGRQQMKMALVLKTGETRRNFGFDLAMHCAYLSDTIHKNVVDSFY